VHQFFLASKAPTNLKPYIEFKERWVNDNPFIYSYRLVIPHLKYHLNFEQGNKDLKRGNFSFRYEKHDKPDHYPEYHLHVLDGVPPSYPTKRLENFQEFFEIVERGLYDNGKMNFDFSKNI